MVVKVAEASSVDQIVFAEARMVVVQVAAAMLVGQIAVVV